MRYPARSRFYRCGRVPIVFTGFIRRIRTDNESARCAKSEDFGCDQVIPGIESKIDLPTEYTE